MIDFTKAKIGQEVTCYLLGKGRITEIDDGNSYPIVVSFQKHIEQRYTKDGRYYKYSNPTLAVGHVDFPQLDQGELPEPEPKPLKWKGEFVWAYIADTDDYEIAKKAGKRLIIGFDSNTDVFIAIKNGDYLYNPDGTYVLGWKYAWEVEE